MSAITSKEEGMSEDDLKAIEARAEAATPGPWEREHGIIWGDSGRQKVASSGALTHDIGTLEFIAAARQDVPELLAEVRRLRAELDRVVPFLALHGYDGVFFDKVRQP